jgi:hypothetical protein
MNPFAILRLVGSMTITTAPDILRPTVNQLALGFVSLLDE